VIDLLWYIDRTVRSERNRIENLKQLQEILKHQVPKSSKLAKIEAVAGDVRADKNVARGCGKEGCRIASKRESGVSKPLSNAERQARFRAKQRARTDELAAEVAALRKRLTRLKPRRRIKNTGAVK
jgi:hypothetical protein